MFMQRSGVPFGGESALTRKWLSMSCRERSCRAVNTILNLDMISIETVHYLITTNLILRTSLLHVREALLLLRHDPRQMQC
jgi:hypothetical protein